jgi:hypothetical protein
VRARIGYVAIAALALAVPAAARAQTERLGGRLDDRTRAAVIALVDSARAAGLPGTPLVNKALEGASKGAEGARITAAVRALAGDLARARAALGAASSEAELVAGAAALRAGAAPAFLERLRSDYPRSPIVVPLAVMADLVSRGVPSDTAGRAVLALARAGMRDAELVAFRQSVERDIALGAPAGAAAAVRVNAAERDLGATTAAASPGALPRPPRKP